MNGYVKGLLLFLGFFLVLTTVSGANSIGAVPGTYDFGEVQRGETLEGTVYITTNLGSDFSLSPEYSHPISSTYGNQNFGYSYNISRASQENMNEWLNFRQQTFEVDTSTEEQIRLNSGDYANVEGEINFKIQVPENAEPGHHIGGIELNPDVDSEQSQGPALLNLGVTNPLFVLKIPEKNVDRNIEVMRLNGVRLDEDLARVDILVRNKGDTTVQVMGSDVKIKGGNITFGEANFGNNYISPGEVEVIEAAWRGENVSSNNYNIETELDYLSDVEEVQGSIDIPERIQEEPSYEEVESDESKPIFLILIILGIIFAALIYLNIEIKWAILITLLIGAALYLIL